MGPDGWTRIHKNYDMDASKLLAPLSCDPNALLTTRSVRRKRCKFTQSLNSRNVLPVRANSWRLFLTTMLFLLTSHVGSFPAEAVSLSARDGHIARQPRCTDVQIEDATKMADVVVSGKVVKLMQDAAHSTNEVRMLKGEVEIKRVFKGEEVVDKMAEIMPGRLRPHKMVMVEGFGDPGICRNSVRERDTKIFLLKPNGNGELKLNSSVVTLNLRNLDYVDAVVHSE